MSRVLAVGVFAFATVLSVVPASLAADWPVSRGGPMGTGSVESPFPDQPQVLWKYTATDSAFEAEPVVRGGVIYIGDADGTVHAIRLADGQAVWTKKFEDSGFSAAGAVEGEHLFVGDFFGVVRCLSIQDGEQRWSFDTGSEIFAGPKFFDGSLLVTTESGQLYSFDTKTGDERWRFTIEAPLRCSPTVINGQTLLAGCDEQLHVVDLTTGKEVGAVSIGGPTGSSAAVADGVAYFGAESGVFHAIDAKDSKNPASLWTYRDPRRGQGIRTAAAIGKDIVVYGSQGKAIYGLQRASGEQAWIVPVRSRVESSPVIIRSTDSAGRAAAGTTRGRLLLLDLATGEVVWEYEAGGGFTASPAVVDGKLLIGNSDGTLYCFGKKEP